MHAIVTTIAEHSFVVHILIFVLTVTAIIAQSINLPNRAKKYRKIAITGMLIAIALAALLAAISPEYDRFLYRGVAALPRDLDTHNGLPGGIPNPDAISPESNYRWITADFFPDSQRVSANQDTLTIPGCPNSEHDSLRYFYVGPDKLKAIHPNDGLNARSAFPKVTSYSDKGVTYFVHASYHPLYCELLGNRPLRVFTTP